MLHAQCLISFNFGAVGRDTNNLGLHLDTWEEERALVKVPSFSWNSNHVAEC